MEIPQSLAAQLRDAENQIESLNVQIAELTKARDSIQTCREGMLVAITAFEAAAATAEPQAEPARKRRDIRALVAEYRKEFPNVYGSKLIAEAIGCRVSQVEAALKALNGAGE